ncbi:MAG: hypothetical protein JO078_11560 [Candidatus Eremiobacteraeota bacterium]|nr:hypothetical protein [Candidatus Eremiobacteraeota bacterium]MBV9057343.1 hypothetical protein [Candidatus Eremiobacteraeota bacterium]MBV9700746.1 hypothetical protein [Candidatus Eremiobacteraeota bacterium]
MESSRHILRLIAGSAAFVLLLTACQGGSPPSNGQYLPSGTAGMSAPNGPVVTPAGGERREIVSTCGNRIKIKVAGILKCRFHERGYDDKTFTITNNTNGLVSISPTKVTDDHRITIVGVAVGSGYFTVAGKGKHTLVVHVKVSL